MMIPAARGCKNDYASQCFEGSFRKAIWPILALSQIFGVMPLSGLSCRSIFDLQFKWKSKRTVYGLFTMTIIVSYTAIRLCNTLVEGIRFTAIVHDLFYIVNSFGFISLFVLTQSWPQLMEHWETMEASLTTSCNFKLKKSRMLALRVTAFILLLLAIVEHSLVLATVIHSVGANHTDLIKKLAEVFLPLFNNAYDNIPVWAILPFFFITECATYVWHFLDLLIIMISIGLATLFELLNHEIEHTDIENQTAEFWSSIRSNYRKLRKLVFLIDRNVSHIILVSFSNDLLLICVQLHELLRFRALSTVHFAYFCFSFIYINIRTFGMALLAARIHDESKKPMKLACNIPEQHALTNEYNAFVDEVNGNTVALSGMEFFFLTRKLILSIIGTICTYELVLLQFHRG